MKKGRFLWSAHRITEKQKAGKARNIKGKQLKNSRNQVSKQLVEHHSSQRDNYLFENYNSKRLQTSELRFWGFSLPLNLDEMSRNVVKLIRFATKKSIPIFCMKKIFTIRTTEDVYGKAKL